MKFNTLILTFLILPFTMFARQVTVSSVTRVYVFKFIALNGQNYSEKIILN